MQPIEAVDRLRREHRLAAGTTPYATTHVRLGTGLWVDERDVDAAIDEASRTKRPLLLDFTAAPQ